MSRCYKYSTSAEIQDRTSLIRPLKSLHPPPSSPSTCPASRRPRHPSHRPRPQSNTSPQHPTDMRPSQRPTCTGLRVRSTRDANVLFHAVTCGIVPMVNRRLDAADRAAMRPGCVWEERSPASDATGTGMERFTEGRHWHPSRMRDVSPSSSSVSPLPYVWFPPLPHDSFLTSFRLQDFLLYIEKDWESNEAQELKRNRMLRYVDVCCFPSSWRNLRKLHLNYSKISCTII